MGSRLMSLFFGRASNNNTNLKGQPYDAAVASEPPVQGSYPVAGNGPNVLEEIQRTRAQRRSLAPSTTQSISSAAPAPSIPTYRQRDPDTPRPRTAPHNGAPGGGQQRATKAKIGRTLSGYSMKSPPTFFNSSRRNSINNTPKRHSMRTTADNAPPLPPASPPFPAYIPTYQPKTGGGTPGSSVRNGVVAPSAPSAQHSRATSIATNNSHKSHVDLLDAHSNIDGTRETSKHRAKASGVRNYGEDVADRNIVEFGHKGKGDRESRIDLTSPEFSHLKQVYAPQKLQRRQGRPARSPHSQVDSALGHVLGSDGSSDDTYHPRTQSHPRTSSIRSFTRPRSGVAYPPRTDSAPGKVQHPSKNGRTDDDRSVRSHSDRRGRALSPLSSRSASIREEPSIQDDNRAVSTPPIPECGRHRALSTNSSTANQYINPPPVVPPPVRRSTQINSQGSPDAYIPSNQRHRTMSTMSLKTVVPSNANVGTPSTKGSMSYAAFPPNDKRTSQAYGSATSPPPSTVSRDMSRRGDMLVEGTSETPTLEGAVDLKDSVDTDVTTTTLPAVVHEHITPVRHETRQESVTREIHTHDVYHRILPVIEREVLPTKHYILSQDGKSLIEISESQVAEHTATKSYSQNWHIAPGPAPEQNSRGSIDRLSRSSTDSFEGLNIGLAHRDPNSSQPPTNSTKSVPDTKIARPRGNSTKSTKSKNLIKEILQPILSSKKETITEEGHPKIEYIWRHPPQLETAMSETHSALVPTASEGDQYYSDDSASVDFGAERLESNLLFRDSGYGSGGIMLPGLPLQNATTVGAPQDNSTMGERSSPQRKSVGASDYSKDVEKAQTLREFEEATSALQNLRAKGKNKSIDKGKRVDDLERGIRNMNVR